MDAEHYIPNLEHHRQMLIKVRHKIGRITSSVKPSLNFHHPNKKVLVHTTAVMTTKSAAMKWEVAYDQNLTPVGYYVSVPKMPKYNRYEQRPNKNEGVF